ncbi:MAG: MOSC domain-containing protein [Burkholderiales bacterium]|nr:MOSC domain-containing protein [Burkholderiales bacterium]
MRILSVNVGRAQALRVGGREFLSAIGKRPVDGPVAVRQLGLAGDEQADLSAHGGITKAVYAYPSEHFAFWQTVRAQARAAAWDEAVPPGLLGENLTLQGIAEDRLWVGDRLRLPGCVLAVSEPRRPCDKLGAALGFAQAVRLMVQSGFCGSYLAVVEPGTLRAGDPIELIPGPREVNLRELFRARMAGRRNLA